eukprot:4663034-Pyramimonas_sp.AAC.1
MPAEVSDPTTASAPSGRATASSSAKRVVREHNAARAECVARASARLRQLPAVAWHRTFAWRGEVRGSGGSQERVRRGSGGHQHLGVISTDDPMALHARLENA